MSRVPGTHVAEDARPARSSAAIPRRTARRGGGAERPSGSGGAAVLAPPLLSLENRPKTGWRRGRDCFSSSLRVRGGACPFRPFHLHDVLLARLAFSPWRKLGPCSLSLPAQEFITLAAVASGDITRGDPGLNMLWSLSSVEGHGADTATLQKRSGLKVRSLKTTPPSERPGQNLSGGGDQGVLLSGVEQAGAVGWGRRGLCAARAGAMEFAGWGGAQLWGKPHPALFKTYAKRLVHGHCIGAFLSSYHPPAADGMAIMYFNNIIYTIYYDIFLAVAWLAVCGCSCFSHLPSHISEENLREMRENRPKGKTGHLTGAIWEIFTSLAKGGFENRWKNNLGIFLLFNNTRRFI